MAGLEEADWMVVMMTVASSKPKLLAKLIRATLDASGSVSRYPVPRNIHVSTY